MRQSGDRHHQLLVKPASSRISRAGNHKQLRIIPMFTRPARAWALINLPLRHDCLSAPSNRCFSALATYTRNLIGNRPTTAELIGNRYRSNLGPSLDRTHSMDTTPGSVQSGDTSESTHKRPAEPIFFADFDVRYVTVPTHTNTFLSSRPGTGRMRSATKGLSWTEVSAVSTNSGQVFYKSEASIAIVNLKPIVKGREYFKHIALRP